jgi:hypothetical protein
MHHRRLLLLLLSTGTLSCWEESATEPRVRGNPAASIPLSVFAQQLRQDPYIHLAAKLGDRPEIALHLDRALSVLDPDYEESHPLAGPQVAALQQTMLSVKSVDSLALSETDVFSTILDLTITRVAMVLEVPETAASARTGYTPTPEQQETQR